MKKIFTLLVIIFLLYAGPGWATVYYSKATLGFVGLTSSWADGSGISPANFSNPADEFHIKGTHIMRANNIWTVAGKVVIETGGTFNAATYDHDITIDMWANAKYNITVPEFDIYTYDNLKFGTLDNSSTIRITLSGAGDGAIVLRSLTYPTLTLAGAGFAIIDSDIQTNKDFNIEGAVNTYLTSSLIINQNLSVKGGILNIDNPASISIGGNLNVIGGELTGNTAGGGATTINITGDLIISSGILSGSFSDDALGNSIFNIGGNFNMTGGTFNGVGGNSNSIFNITGSFLYQGGTYNGKSGVGTGLTTLSLNGTGDISSLTMTNRNQKVNIAGSYGLQTDFTVGNVLTLSSGNLSLNGHTLTLNNALTITGGTLTGDNSAGMTFGPASVGASLPAVTLGTLTINRSGQTISQAGNVTVANTLSLSTGTLSIGANTLTLAGLISGTGAITGGISSNLVLNGSGSLTLPSIILQNLTINRGTSDIVTLSGNVTVNNSLNLTKGQLDNSSFLLLLANNATISKDLGELVAIPTFGTKVNLIYVGNVAVNTGFELPTDQVTLNNLTVSKTGATGLTLNTDVTVNGSLTIAASSKLNGGSQVLTVKGNWINNGTFTPSTGTVEFAGSTALSGTVVNTTFNNLSLASGASLTVPVGSITSITGDFTVSPTASFNHNNATIAYTGTATQNIAGINYYNLSSSNTGGRVLNGTIGVANTFTPGTNVYITTGSTVNYNGTNQTISTFTYNNLSLSNSGTKTPAGISLTTNDLTLAGSAVLDGNAKTINVAGNWISYGATAFSETGSKVVFNGSAPQSITTAGGEIFNDLTINMTISSTVSLNSLVTVNGILALTNGTLASAGKLTVNLNSGSVAYAPTDAGIVTGNIKISKSINSTKTHYLACPLTGTTANDFADNTPVTDPSKPGGTRLFEYINGSWSQITDMNTGLAPFKAYSLYFTAPTTLDFTGNYEHGFNPSEITFPNSTSEFRMVGNPFPSTIDWSKAGWTKNNINNAIYYWDAATSKYATYVNNSGTNGGTPYIPALQGFFVTTSGLGGTASLSMNNNVRTSTQNPSLWRTSIENQPVLNLTAQNGTYSDETVLKFTEDASDLFDGNLDALKLKNAGDNPNLSTLTNGKSYSINSLPLNYIDSTIPLKLEAPVTGNYVIAANQFSGFDTTDIILIDKLLNISYDLKSSNGYSAAITKGDTTSRFYIKFRKSDVVTGISDQVEGKVAVNANGKTVNVYFSNIEEKEASIVFLNIIGQEVDRAENVNISQGLYTKNLNVSTGVYIVKVKAGAKVYTEKVYINN
ncbi:MAG: T9SS type A sorting domain-containing protein [Sporocytophaga sp.]|uniref:T9SS type A sorting domain-containing protein n=1 Tax=Sporocytophaga sp. TaxID=2231183 RepID=UPI001B18F1DC|nr:T9SS type A sorting domain-containing protein [Sporocytophaga sp.]MBO9699703.1 T9SS type A sorting domain-containing protein [Sporocytophaga sp.]